MMNKMNEVFRRVLNDKEIFDSPYDRNTKEPIPKLFERDSWKELSQTLNEIQLLCQKYAINFEDLKKLRDEDKIPEELKEKIKVFEKTVKDRVKEIEKQEKTPNKWRQSRISELKRRAEWLIDAIYKKPYLLKSLFENLEWYGLVECKLPRMEDYGKVIERYDISIVEQYFVDKIKRASYPQNRALEKILEYVKELHTAGISPEEIAYLVRKIDSLAKYWEVIE